MASAIALMSCVKSSSTGGNTARTVTSFRSMGWAAQLVTLHYFVTKRLKPCEQLRVVRLSCLRSLHLDTLRNLLTGHILAGSHKYIQIGIRGWVQRLLACKTHDSAEGWLCVSLACLGKLP